MEELISCMVSFPSSFLTITSSPGLDTLRTPKPPHWCKPAPARAPSHVFCALRSPSKANDCSTVFSPAFAHPSPDSSPPPHFSRSTREYTSGAIRCTRGARARARYSDRRPRAVHAGHTRRSAARAGRRNVPPPKNPSTRPPAQPTPSHTSPRPPPPRAPGNTRAGTSEHEDARRARPTNAPGRVKAKGAAKNKSRKFLPARYGKLFRG